MSASAEMHPLRDPGLFNKNLAPVAADKRTVGRLQLRIAVGGDERVHPDLHAGFQA